MNISGALWVFPAGARLVTWLQVLLFKASSGCCRQNSQKGQTVLLSRCSLFREQLFDIQRLLTSAVTTKNKWSSLKCVSNTSFSKEIDLCSSG